MLSGTYDSVSEAHVVLLNEINIIEDERNTSTAFSMCLLDTIVCFVFQ
jgi:hypothetical protein